MSFTRRAVLVGTAACALGASSADPDGALFATLDAVGPFLGNVFHPGRAIAASSRDGAAARWARQRL